MSPATVLRTAGAVVAEVVRLVLVEPVRDGRLRADGWPAGLRAIVGLALAGLAAGAAMVVAAPLVRQHSDLTLALGGDLVYPRWTTAFFMVLVVLTLALLHAASLHLTPWLRVATLFVVVLAVVGAVIDTIDDNLPANIVSWVGAGLLVLLTAVRWRASFRWWEFVVSLLLVGGSLGVAFRLVGGHAQPLGFDTGPLALVLDMQLIGTLAIPFTFVAGLAFAQLSVLLTHRVGSVVDERVRPVPVVAGIVAGLAAADLALVVLHLRRPTESGAGHALEWGSAAVLLALALAVAVLVVLRSGRPEGRVLDRLEDAVSGLALPIGLAVTIAVVLALLVGRLDTQIGRFVDANEELRLDGVVDVLTGTTTITWTRVVVGMVLLAWAVHQRRRRTLPAVLAATIGTTLLVTMAGNATRQVVDLPWTSEALTDVAAVATIATLAGLAAVRRLDRPRLVALGIALGLSLAFSVRSTFDAPFVVLLGLGASAALFLGVLWATLTDADDANLDSARYPRPARVLFFLANALLAMTTLAFTSVADVGELGIDTSPFAVLGDDYLGTGLLLAAYAVLAWEVVTARESPRCSPAS